MGPAQRKRNGSVWMLEAGTLWLQGRHCAGIRNPSSLASVVRMETWLPIKSVNLINQSSISNNFLFLFFFFFLQAGWDWGLSHWPRSDVLYSSSQLPETQQAGDRQELIGGRCSRRSWILQCNRPDPVGEGAYPSQGRPTDQGWQEASLPRPSVPWGWVGTDGIHHVWRVEVWAAYQHWITVQLRKWGPLRVPLCRFQGVWQHRREGTRTNRQSQGNGDSEISSQIFVFTLF